MRRCGIRRLFVLWIAAACCGTVLTGCGNWWSAESQTAEVPRAPAESQNLAERKASDLPATSLQLQVGDRFPLQKTVHQALLQPSPQGEQRSSSVLDLLLTISVEEQPQSGPKLGQTRLTVTYHRVRYQRDLAGQQITFDSETSQGKVPTAALGYQGLVGNGFSFWIGSDNKIVEIVDFEGFLQRCLQGIPERNRAQVTASLAAQSGAEGIANFIDDSVGLLPHKTVKIGETWSVNRRIQQPIPMSTTTEYKLQEVSATQAEVAILGTVTPAATVARGLTEAGQENRPGVGQIDLTIRGGQIIGNCTIDRRTGLPIHSQTEQLLSMDVRLGNGEAFTQHKQTITTIRAFPEGRPAPEPPARVAKRSATRTTTRPIRTAEADPDTTPR